jgi:hypothetical protein
MLACACPYRFRFSSIMSMARGLLPREGAAAPAGAGCWSGISAAESRWRRKNIKPCQRACCGPTLLHA